MNIETKNKVIAFFERLVPAYARHNTVKRAVEIADIRQTLGNYAFNGTEHDSIRKDLIGRVEQTPSETPKFVENAQYRMFAEEFRHLYSKREHNDLTGRNFSYLLIRDNK